MNPPTRDENVRPANTPAYHDAYPEGGRAGGDGGLYLNAYEVSFPLEERMEQPSVYHLNQTQQNMEEPGGLEPPPQYNPFMLISNLRTHLYVSLEKNAWLQKRIEDLEEERTFLRCQLERFTSNMRSREDWSVDAKQGVYVKAQPASSPTPPSPMVTRSGRALQRLQTQGPRTRQSSAVPVKQEVQLDEEDYYEEDEYVQEEEEKTDDEDSSEERGSKRAGKGARAGGKMKKMRIFRITHGRERQRVKDPEGVLLRYKKILATYQRVRSMSRAFNIHGVDRNTMASTSPIAEMLLVAPEKVPEVGEFEASKEKLLDYARRCYKTMDEQTHANVQTMKKTHQLLPISYRFRN